MRRDDPHFARWTDAAIAEQVVDFAAPSPATDPLGWSVVGEIHDHVADERREVWWQAATDRVRTRVMPWVGAFRSEPVEDGPAYDDGTRRSWSDRATGRDLGPNRPR